MAFFEERIIARITNKQDRQLRDLLTRKGIENTAEGWEFKYDNISHVVRCAINVLWQKEFGEENVKKE